MDRKRKLLKQNFGLKVLVKKNFGKKNWWKTPFDQKKIGPKRIGIKTVFVKKKMGPKNMGPKKKRLGPKSSVKIWSVTADMDQCHQYKCCVDKSWSCSWSWVRKSPENKLTLEGWSGVFAKLVSSFTWLFQPNWV